jgi:hypothetical protein
MLMLLLYGTHGKPLNLLAFSGQQMRTVTWEKWNGIAESVRHGVY